MMKRALLLFVLYSIFTATMAFAEPIVTNNVHVFPNATPTQCTADWNGDSQPIEDEFATGSGGGNIITPGMLSCTGCAIDTSSGDCVCKTCYDYTN